MAWDGDRQAHRPGRERTNTMSPSDEVVRSDHYQPVPLLGKAQRLSVYIDETVQYKHHPLYTEIVHRAHAHGMAGATVLRGIEGYGASNHIHTTRLLSLCLLYTSPSPRDRQK